MTKEQMKICRIILKYKKLDDILYQTHIDDYYSLQEKFYPKTLDFSDYDFGDDTIVYLTTDLLEEYESQKERTFYNRGSFIVSILALCISILGSIGSNSILGHIISLFLK